MYDVCMSSITNQIAAQKDRHQFHKVDSTWRYLISDRAQTAALGSEISRTSGRTMLAMEMEPRHHTYTRVASAVTNIRCQRLRERRIL